MASSNCLTMVGNWEYPHLLGAMNWICIKVLHCIMFCSLFIRNHILLQLIQINKENEQAYLNIEQD